ncbi:MAG: hypothetical protein H0U44_01970 [Flavisolibacter sp.]|jgi:energy-coupling factor transporter transmembrane protein EcfT|nr:hypothetical protein [Flavisolibacter sp.]
MTSDKMKLFFPVIGLFSALTGLFFVARTRFENMGVDADVVLIGNLLLFFITFLSFYLGVKGLKNPNPHAFVRSLYMSIMIKFFLCIIAAVIYIATYKSGLNKPALFICMGLYLLYTFIEVSVLTKMLRRKEQ